MQCPSPFIDILKTNRNLPNIDPRNLYMVATRKVRTTITKAFCFKYVVVKSYVLYCCNASLDLFAELNSSVTLEQILSIKILYNGAMNDTWLFQFRSVKSVSWTTLILNFKFFDALYSVLMPHNESTSKSFQWIYVLTDARATCLKFISTMRYEAN